MDLHDIVVSMLQNDAQEARRLTKTCREISCLRQNGSDKSLDGCLCRHAKSPSGSCFREGAPLALLSRMGYMPDFSTQFQDFSTECQAMACICNIPSATRAHWKSSYGLKGGTPAE